MAAAMQVSSDNGNCLALERGPEPCTSCSKAKGVGSPTEPTSGIAPQRRTSKENLDPTGGQPTLARRSQPRKGYTSMYVTSQLRRTTGQEQDRADQPGPLSFRSVSEDSRAAQAMQAPV